MNPTTATEPQKKKKKLVKVEGYERHGDKVTPTSETYSEAGSSNKKVLTRQMTEKPLPSENTGPAGSATQAQPSEPLQTTTPFNPDYPTLTHEQTVAFTQDEARRLKLIAPETSEGVKGDLLGSVAAVGQAVKAQFGFGEGLKANTGSPLFDTILEKAANNFLTTAAIGATAATLIPPLLRTGKATKEVLNVGATLEDKLDFYMKAQSALNNAGKVAKSISSQDVINGLTAKAASGTVGETILRTTTNLATGKVTKFAINTVTAKQTASYLSQLVTGAKNPMAVLGILGTVLYASVFWAPNEKNDALRTLGIMQNQAVRDEDFETVKQIDELMQETLDISEQIPVSGFRQAEIANFKSAALTSEINMRKAYKMREAYKIRENQNGRQQY